MKIKLIIGTMIISSMFSYAAEMDMKTAVDTAYKNNYDIQKMIKDVEAKDIDKKRADKQIFPKLTYNLSAVKMSAEVPTMLYNGNKISMPSSDSNYSQKISLQQPIYVGGVIENGSKMMELSKTLAEVQLTQKKHDVKMEVMQNYLGILKLIKSKSNLENSLNEMNEMYNKLNESYKLGLIQKKPVLDVKYRIAEIKTGIISNDKDIELRMIKLKNSLGVSDEEKIEIKDIEIPEIDIKQINLKDDISFASDKKLIIKTARLAKELSKVTENLKFSELLPKVYLGANYELKVIQPKDILNNGTYGSWNIGINATWNIFDMGSAADDVARAKKETEKKEIEEKTTQRNIEIMIKTSYIEIEKLKNILNTKNEALESSTENYKIEKQKFDLEISTSTDLLSAENDLRKIETDIINTKIDLYNAYLKYNDLIEREEI